MIRYLHISDLHLTFIGDRGPVEAFNQDIVTGSMIQMIRKERFDVDFVIITGDIARAGTPPEYEVCGVFCSELLDALGLDRRRLFLVPGNHDVDRSRITPKQIKSFYGFNDQDEITETLTDPDLFPILLRKFEAFRVFAEDAMGERGFGLGACWYGERLNLEKPDREYRVNLAGLNSCLFAGYDGDEKGNLAIGLYQADAVLKGLENADFSICFFHHPFSCFHPADKVCRNLLMNRFDLILTGHLHDPENAFTQNAAGQAVIIGAGAGYEARESRNSFNLVEIDPETGAGRVEFYKYLPDHHRWKKDTDVNPDADDGGFRFQIGEKGSGGMEAGAGESKGSTTNIHISNSQIGHMGDHAHIEGGIRFDNSKTEFSVKADRIEGLTQAGRIEKLEQNFGVPPKKKK